MSHATEINVEERNALYDQILSHLVSVDDLRIAIEKEDFDQAGRLGIEFGDELRLMEDLGWGRHPAGTTFRLTMGSEQLRRVLTRLRSDAEGLTRDEEHETATIENEARDRLRRATCITEACERVLSTVRRATRPQRRDHEAD